MFDIEYLNPNIFENDLDDLYEFYGMKQHKKKLPQAIINGTTTVLIDSDGNKYFSRPEKDKKFDKEKGILICLAKMAGFTTTDILEIVEKAKIQDNKK